MITDINELRRKAWYLLPLFFFGAVAPAWIFIFSLQQLMQGFRNQEPVLHIQSGVVLMPLGSVMMLLALALGIARCIPLQELATNIERWFLRLLLVILILIPIVMISGSLIQNHYLPKLGYSKCTDLMHNRSILANFWIKPADLCVSGKTVDWVREQAAKRANESKSTQ
jgi:hypothetical protein